MNTSSHRGNHKPQFIDFIKENIEEIMLDWEEFARSLPLGKDMHVAQLRDHARQILETIAEDMASSQSEAEQESRSRGKGPVKKLSLEFAALHATIRHEEGFDLNEVVAEYRALRASVIRLWTRRMHSADMKTLDALTRFNEEIDQALTYAVQEYSALTERTREANNYKSEFLAILAHELRNPLAPIRTGIEVLRLTEGIPAAADAPLTMMERQMSHLVRLVDDLLDISRMSRGNLNLRLANVEIAGAVRSAVEATATYLYAGKRKVTIELPSEPLLVQGDAVRLVQVLGNLLSNAGKYTDEDGHIWISARREGQHAKIVVRDDGVGIVPKKMNNLFKMFQQLDATRREGLGIGLALAHNLVELHKGSITGSSEGLGRGSVFVLCLPLLQEGHEAVSPAKGTDNIKLNGLRVLVVDDNRDAARSLNMLLQLLGAQPRLAHDGPSALAQLEEFLPDVVLLDIGLPGMDGYEVARRMREQAAGENIRIVAVSGWGQDEDRQRSVRAGINEHLVKPINLEDIARVMASLMPQRVQATLPQEPVLQASAIEVPELPVVRPQLHDSLSETDGEQGDRLIPT